MKWITRALALIGVFYGGLMLAGSFGIGHSFFYYGQEPIQVLIDQHGNKVFVIGNASYNELNITSNREVK